MPFKWTPEAEAKMLLAAVKHCDVKPPAEFFERVASLLGPETNANGCSQKFYKLKREGDVVLSQGDASAATPVTPASNKKSAKKTPASSGRKRKATDDAESTPATPSKKTAKGKSKDKIDDADRETTETKKEESPVEGTNADEDEI